MGFRWLRELDLNQRPSGYEPDELPDCSIPRHRLQISDAETKKPPIGHTGSGFFEIVNGFPSRNRWLQCLAATYSSMP